MLAVPAFRTINDVTIFQDDTVWYRFYPVVPTPRVRLDKNGNPVFLLVKYAFSDEDREAKPELPSGGGYLNFDVELAVSDEVMEQVRVELQQWVDAEWTRLKQGTPQERAMPGVEGNEPPAVEFAEPTWTNGTVAMDAPQAEELVQARVASGTPSLVAGNVSVFSLDLTTAGATFMAKTLAGPQGDEGSDLTLLQVRSDLKFWARLPAVKMTVTSDSERMFNHVHKIMDGRGVDHCTTYDFQNSDLTTTTAHLSGLIDVKFDDGAGSLDPETREELRDFALGLIEEMVESSFFSDVPEMEIDPTVPDLREPSHLARRTKNNSKKYLRENYNEATMKLEVNIEQRAVVEWSIHPQSTLETFFRGLSTEELRRYVKTVDLDDDFFKHLGLTARAFADYEDPALSGVEVQLSYEGRDENGEHQEKTESFTFVSNEPRTWNPSLIGGQREYQYRYRPLFVGRQAPEFSEWQKSEAPDLNISIPSPGRVETTVVSGSIDYENLVDQVQVTLAYEDVRAGIPRQEHTLVLTQSNQGQKYQRLIYDFQRTPLMYQQRFTLKTGEVLEDGQWREIQGDQILINQPFLDSLNVRLMPTGDGWADIAGVVVDLRYRDEPNRYKVEKSMSLKSHQDFRTWEVVLLDKTKRDFEYRISTSYTDGRFEQSDWINKQDSMTIPISIQAPPRIHVKVMPDLLDFAVAPVTETVLHYQNNGIDETETLIFRDHQPQDWTIQVPAESPVRYHYQVTHYPPQSEPVVLPQQEEQDPVVVLQPYRPPKAGMLQIQVMSQLVDFEQTPIVAIDLEYEDEDNDMREIGSHTFGAKDVFLWSIQVPDINRRLFGYRITYFDTSGESHVGEMTYKEIPRVIIPKFVSQ